MWNVGHAHAQCRRTQCCYACAGAFFTPCAVGRQALMDALAPLARLGPDYLAASEGAIYLWAKLPPGARLDAWTLQW